MAFEASRPYVGIW